MRIQHNIPAMNSYRNYNNNQSRLGKNLEKLSSGYAINRAGDDAAGLAISEKMRAQITGIEVATKNAKDGISVVQTAEGALTEVHDMLNRMYALAEQSCNGIYQKEEKEKLQAELDQLITEINRIGDSTNFNGLKLLDGTLQDAPTPKTEASRSEDALSSLAGVGEVSGVSFKWSTLADKSMKDQFNSDVNGKNIKVQSSRTVDPADAADPIKFKLRVVLDDMSDYTVKSATISKSDIRSEDITDDQVLINMDATQRKGAALTVTIQDKNKNEIGTLAFTVSSLESTAQYTFAEAANIVLMSDRTPTNSAVKQQPMQLQIGDSTNAYDKVYISVDSMRARDLGLVDMDIITAPGDAMGRISNAIEAVSVQRGSLGAYQNRLEHTLNNLSVMRENIQDAEATIRDTDMAEEMMKYTKNNILVQSAQSMLAQANQLPQGVLGLLQ